MLEAEAGLKQMTIRVSYPEQSPILRRKAVAWAISLAFMAAMFAAAAQAQTFTVLYEFPGGPQGANPIAGLARDSAGNLYGTLASGGNTSCYSGCGVVFSFDPAGIETVLYSFTGTNGDGDDPVSGLLRDSAGNLYGTTQSGGATGCGTVYKVDPTGYETVLYSFAGNTDGCGPDAGVIADLAGNLYGTTYGGGDSTCSVGGCGVVYKLAPDGTETILHVFHGPDGAFPVGGNLVGDPAGNLYGLTVSGGPKCPWDYLGCGVAYRLSPSGQEVFYQFTGYTDGHSPAGSLLRDSAGNIYGVASGGGNMSCNTGNGCGVIFKFDPAGKLTVMHSFSGSDGSTPDAGVIQDAQGNFYGTTTRGGTTDLGTVYTLRTNGKVIVLHSFTGDEDGWDPVDELLVDPAGNLYGTAVNGGTYNGGAMFAITH